MLKDKVPHALGEWESANITVGYHRMWTGPGGMVAQKLSQPWRSRYPNPAVFGIYVPRGTRASAVSDTSSRCFRPPAIAEMERALVFGETGLVFVAKIPERPMIIRISRDGIWQMGMG